MELIDKSAVVAELESKRKYSQHLGDNAINSSMQQFYDGMKQGCVDILSSINTLEVKEVGEPSNDLEEAATKYAQDKYMPVQTAEAFRAGYNKCRQEMMNSAIEREVKVDAGGYPYIDATELYDYENDRPLAKAGDKVKVVFIKDK
jgi:hypothetical protein